MDGVDDRQDKFSKSCPFRPVSSVYFVFEMKIRGKIFRQTGAAVFRHTGPESALLDLCYEANSAKISVTAGNRLRLFADAARGTGKGTVAGSQDRSGHNWFCTNN
jgi:hypothetical protein